MSFWSDSEDPADPRGGFTDHPDFAIQTEQPGHLFPGNTTCYHPSARSSSSEGYTPMDDD